MENIAENSYLASRIITLERARELQQDGWRCMDLHAHSYFSHDVPPAQSMAPLALYESAISGKNGIKLDFFTLTDHDTIRGIRSLDGKKGVIPGVEVSIRDPSIGHEVHINVFDFAPIQYQEIRRIKKTASVHGLLAYLNEAQLPHVYNHPFWNAPNDTLNLGAVLNLIPQFPVIEYNMGRIKQLNLAAMALARLNGKGILAAGDSHVGDIGRAITVTPPGTFRECFDHIKLGRAYVVPVDLDVNTAKRLTTKWFDVALERRDDVPEKGPVDLEIGRPTLDVIAKRTCESKILQYPGIHQLVKSAIGIIVHTTTFATSYIREQEKLFAAVQSDLEAKCAQVKHEMPTPTMTIPVLS